MEIDAGTLVLGALWVAGITFALIVIRVTGQRLREIEAGRAGRSPRRRESQDAPEAMVGPTPPLADAWWTTLESVAAMTPQQWVKTRAELDAVAGRRDRVPGAVRAVLRVIHERGE